MLNIRILCAFAILFLITSIVSAQTYRIVNQGYYVRSSPDFSEGNESNKVGTLEPGSTFRVVKIVTLPTGALAYQIHMVGLTGNSSVQPSPAYWIYKSKYNDKDFVNLGGETAPAQLPTQGAAPQAPCLACSTPPLNSGQSAQQNVNDLSDVAQSATLAANTLPKVKPKILEPAIKPQPVVSPVTAPVSTTPGSLDAKIKAYSESAATKNTIDFALRNKKSRSTGKCYRSVKDALSCSKNRGRGTGNCLIPSWYSGTAALSAKDSLKRYGFVNLLDSEPYKSRIGNSPNLAPKGAVLVYSSGIPCSGTVIPDCGHVEIKTDHEGKPGYVSDYYSGDAINQTAGARRYGTRYKLVGVMIKP